MSEPKHTPGPWNVGTCDNWIVWAPRYGATDWVPAGATIDTPEAVCVASVHTPAWTMAGLDDTVRDAWLAEADATSRLISSAPEMFEALQACASIMPRYHMAGKTTGEDEELAAVLERVIEAIAKATT